jgi:hypothetical protein
VRLPEGTDLSKAGVGPHPHYGFSPVSFLFKGGAHHRDSRGHNHRVMAGGTQWMNAGRGIVHSERPAAHEMELIQMWVNTPAKHKRDQPAYLPLSADDTPQWASPDGRFRAGVVAGDWLGTQGPLPTQLPIQAAMLHADAGGEAFPEIPEGHQAFVYVLEGRLRVGGTEVTGHHLAVLAPDGQGIRIEAAEASRALFMSGLPIGEPLVAQGPFVAASEMELMQAYRDYQMGRMGVLIED